jgi:hypothetical protein
VRAACLGRSQISQVATEELSRGSHCGNGLWNSVKFCFYPNFIARSTSLVCVAW